MGVWAGGMLEQRIRIGEFRVKLWQLSRLGLVTYRFGRNRSDPTRSATKA